MKQGRVKYCDTLKAISIILVILIHVLAGYRDMYLANDNRLYYYLLSFADSFTRTAVPTFFMITGIFMLSKNLEKDYKSYLKKRIPKLLIPLLIFSIAYYLFENIENDNKLSLLSFFQEVTNSGGVIYHLWFMYDIIKIYLLIPFLSILVKHLSKKKLNNLIILLFLMGNFMQFIALITARININLFQGIAYSKLTMCINYLFLGYYLYKYDLKPLTKKLIYVGAILSIIILPIADLFYVFVDKIRLDVLYTVDSIFPILPTIALFILFKRHYQKWKIFHKIEPITSKIAKLSLWIYMIHVMIMKILIKYLPFPQRFISVVITVIIIWVLTTILSLIFSIIFEWFYEKVKNFKLRLST